MYRNKTAKLVVKEQGALSAGEDILAIYSHINRGLSRYTGLAGIKVK